MSPIIVLLLTIVPVENRNTDNKLMLDAGGEARLLFTCQRYPAVSCLELVTVMVHLLYKTLLPAVCTLTPLPRYSTHCTV